MSIPQMLRYAVVGTGAVGGYYGGLLARSGADIHFFARSDADAIRQHGLRVESCDGDYTIESPSVFSSSDEMPQCDVILVCVKTTANPQIRSLIEPLLHDRSIVVILQNGLFVEQHAAEVVGSNRVIGGCVFLCSTKVGPGQIKHTGCGRVVLGAYRGVGGADTPIDAAWLKRISEDFTKAKIDIGLSENLYADRWKKLLWNIPFNGLSVVLDASTDLLTADAAAAELIRHIMQEVQGIARQAGVHIEDAFIDKLIRETATMVPYDSSMRVDYRAHRPMELAAIFEAPLAEAKKLNHPAPLLSMLWRQLCFFDNRNRHLKS
jgi:2-dehydropantoate 2-reductase